MAEIRNYTMNFSYGRAAATRLTCAERKLACTEVDRFIARSPKLRHG
jgi:hypothetical protein